MTTQRFDSAFFDPVIFDLAAIDPPFDDALFDPRLCDVFQAVKDFNPYDELVFDGALFQVEVGLAGLAQSVASASGAIDSISLAGGATAAAEASGELGDSTFVAVPLSSLRLALEIRVLPLAPQNRGLHLALETRVHCVQRY